jgi:PAS domain S-box-containing protein
MAELRKSGIEVLGDIPWGSHICQFYETEKDLLELLIPFFKAGLENNEFCLWVVADPLTKENVTNELKKAIPNFENFLRRESIEILSHHEWYLNKKTFNPKEIINELNERLVIAVKKGYEGMRVNGNESWLQQQDWKDFMKYERELNSALRGKRMIVLCAYPLETSNAAAILDIVHAHQQVISKRNGEWQVVETAMHVKALAEIKRLNGTKPQAEESRSWPVITGYVVAILLVIAAIIILKWFPAGSLGDAPYVSVFLCAVILSTLVGGTGPALLAVVLSAIAFDYYFLPSIHTFAIEPSQLARLILFLVPALFIAWLSAAQKSATKSIRQARKVLEKTVQRLSQTNRMLQAEISERKQAEDELRRSKGYLRLVVDTIPALVVTAVPDGSVDFINQRYREFTGLTLEDVKGWHWISLVHADDRDRVLTEWRTSLSTSKPWRTEMRLRMASGDYCWLLINAVPLRDESGKIVRWYCTKTDITELKHAQEELRRSEDRIRLIIDTIPIMAWTILPDGTVDFVNKRWQDYAGVSLEELIKNPTSAIHPEDLPGILSGWRKSMATGETAEDEMRLRRADGKYRWFLVRTAPLRDKKGNIVKWYGVSTDIEDSKCAKEELRLAYQRLSYHVENTPLAVIEWDKNLDITRWSTHAEELFGWKEFEAIGKNVYDPGLSLIYPEDLQPVNQIAEQLTGGIIDRNRSLNRNYTKDGKMIYCEWYNSVLRDQQGNVITILSLVNDVTEGKIAEEQLKQSETHLAEAQKIAKMGSWSLDVKTGRVTWSEGLYNVFGVDKHIFEQTHDSFLQLVDEQDRDIVLQTNKNTRQTAEPFTIEYRITTSAGEKRYIREHGYGEKDDRGNVVRLFGTAQDVTEQKLAGETLQQSHQEIRRLTDHLQKIRDEERAHIAREIHDELGQQLTAIKMDIVWVDKKMTAEAADIKRKLKNVIGLLDGSNESIRRILSELRPGILDENDWVESIEWLCRQLKETTGIPVKFSVSVPEKELKISNQIAKCMFRVCQEAFTNITRHSQAKNVTVSINIPDGTIILTIEDDGTGFNPETVKNKKSFGILGMRERVLSLSGKFDLISSPGAGTKIIVSLPLETSA